MLNTAEINKVSRPFKAMQLGEKIAGLIDLVDQLRTTILNQCLSKAGLTIGSSDPATVKIANTVTYAIAGLLYSKTTAEVAFTATVHDIANSASVVREACYTLSLAANGDAHLTMGSIASGAGNSVPPAAPANETEIGYVRIAVAAGATPFDASSDALSAGHITDTYYDTLVRPQDLNAAVEALTS